MKKSGEYNQIIRDIEKEVSECVVSMVSLMDDEIVCEGCGLFGEYNKEMVYESEGFELAVLTIKENELFVNDVINFDSLTLDSKIQIYDYLINLDFIKIKV
jgi:hypothetical protein